jgi:hypothetical protein
MVPLRSCDRFAWRGLGEGWRTQAIDIIEYTGGGIRVPSNLARRS